ncbi:MAG TPA: DUF932 domain-containing protein [Verrucomicrobiae bacterium]|nr:DUF932 domain-containing protein [Verrucomicrobiae bacterium]
MIATRSAASMSSVPSGGRVALTDDQLRRAAPSIFAASPWETMSDRYRFIPTIEVVHILKDKGYLPTTAIQSRSRIEGKGNFTKHLLRFREASAFGALVPGQSIAELVLVNSHDGTSGYQLMSGIYEVRCANGMVCHSADLGSVSVRHTGGKDFDQQIIDATYEVMDTGPRTLETIRDWKQLALPAPAREAFAAAVLELTHEKPIQAPQLLRPRREDDKNDSLWTVSNVVQENMIRGGLRGTTPSGKRSTTRAVNSVGENLRLNKAIWTLTEKMAQLIG